MKSQTNFALLCLLFSVFTLAIIAGCGGSGGGNQPAVGRLQFTIAWPKSSRLIPVASQSLKVVLTRGTATVAQHTLARPPAGQDTTNDAFSGLPVGPLSVTVTAYPNPDATGTPQASGATIATITSGGTTIVQVDPASTIATIALSPAAASITPDGNAQVLATALDSQGRMVLTAPSKWQWTSSDPTIASVSATGQQASITGSIFGTAIITATETESNKSGQASITVSQGRSEDWAKFHHDNQNTGQGIGSGATGKVLWSVAAGSLVFASPALDPSGRVFIGSNDGNLYALDGATGAKVWSFTTGRGITSSPAVGPNGLVYFGSGDAKVYALDVTSGSKVWEFQTGGSIFDSSPALGLDGTVYIGSNDGRLYALDGSSGAPKWVFVTKGAIFSSPAVGQDGTVYVGSNDFNLYAVDGATGRQKWVFAMTDEVHSPPSVGPDGTVYVGSTTDHKVYALNGQTGVKKWEFLTGNFVDTSPAIGANGLVYAGGGDQNVYALDAGTGALRWKFATGGRIESSPAVGSDGTVYIGSDDLNLYALDGQTGAKKWQVQPASGQIKSSPAVGADGTIYVGSYDGKVNAIR